MVHTVFWSWQSDAPKRETRDLIHEAVKSAVNELAAELEEVQRIEVDQGAKGVIGMEIIAEEILRKIDRAFAFVCDVSTVATIGEGVDRKCIANPNVMLELGYARKSLGPARVIPVFNRAIGATRFEDLPFDLRHMSGSVSYDLAEGATSEELRRQRARLQKELRDRLRAMIKDAEAEPTAPRSRWHASLAHDPSIWEEAFNPLLVAVRRLGQMGLIVAPAPRIFARLLPAAQGEAPRDYGDLFPGGQDVLLPIGGPPADLSGGRTANGHVIFESVGEDRTTKSIARWYKDNGEIWALSASGFYARNGYPTFAYDEIIKDLVGWLERAARTSRTAGGVGNLRLILGASGLHKVQWGISRPDPGSNPFLGLNDVAMYECTLAADDRVAMVDAVDGFMEQITDNFGVTSLARNQVALLAES
jgi:hypothetical protein